MDKAFRCSICLTVFDSNHKAFILNCGHSYCSAYIDKSLKYVEGTAKQTITCALCKDVSVYDNGK